MLAKTLYLLAFAALAMAAPQRKKDDNSKQQARIAQLRAQGLNCNESFNSGGTFVCTDGFGGDCFINVFGEGNCLI
ncbi:hypothetical protein BKA65DRAFT_546930 [Rhexocercosporidium sp. MPI-PUGE-AT-0058]|nr:hypothetical protein BKA65DRAFT_546930 [Rhexocercosporidium sp. MPI-PUGE-AT-0058]